MSASNRSCVTCDAPVPAGAMFCPKCGEATPTGISRDTGEVTRADDQEAGHAEYEERLQRAIGGGYRLGELIGRGGFGVVYAAWEIELHREVAVKALRHDLFRTADLVERFKREARAAAKLRHNNIVPIYAVGENEGIVYMIMPNIFGEPLSATLQREQRLSVDEAKRILIEAAGALSAAHQAGIVHRDVKPENIFLEGNNRRVYLMDFGIAKALGGEEEGLTGTGMIIGTPTFMSPEQAAGHRDVDHRADIYSLGVLGYQMLAGRLPYQAESLQDLIYQQVTSEPPQLSKISPEVPAAIAAVVHRCLPKDPEERWQSADELVTALTSGHVPSTGSPRRNVIRLALTVAVVVVVGAGAVFGVRALTGPADTSTDGAVAAAAAAPIRTAVEPPAADSSPGQTASQGSDETAAPGGAPPAESTQPARPQPAPAEQSPPPVSRQVQQPQVRPQQVGYLTVDARPWGMVQVDGVNVRESPLFRHELAPGTYVISVVRDGYRPWSDTVTIAAGNPTSLLPVLIRAQ